MSSQYSEWKCPQCQMMNPPTHTVCASCGYAPPQQQEATVKASSPSAVHATTEWLCPHCQSSNAVGQRFCRNCGNFVTTSQSAQSVAQKSVATSGAATSMSQASATVSSPARGSYWLCSYCKTNNPPTLTVCKGCDRTQAGVPTQVAKWIEDKSDGWHMLSGSGSNWASTSYGSSSRSSYTGPRAQPKSIGAAIALEFFIAGAGFMYVKKWGTGIFMLIFTIFMVIVYNGMLQSACPGTYQGGECQYMTNIFIAGQVQDQLQQRYNELGTWAVIIGLLFLVARIVAVVKLVNKYNEENG